MPVARFTSAVVYDGQKLDLADPGLVQPLPWGRNITRSRGERREGGRLLLSSLWEHYAER
jgi:hypothetical protein